MPKWHFIHVKVLPSYPFGEKLSLGMPQEVTSLLERRNVALKAAGVPASLFMVPAAHAGLQIASCISSGQAEPPITAVVLVP